ncbi:hypothetical protein MASR2M78_27150 [Treponema sp.]
MDIAEAAQDCRQNFESLDESALTLLGGEGSLRLRVERIDRIRDSLFENLASTRASISKLAGKSVPGRISGGRSRRRSCMLGN